MDVHGEWRLACLVWSHRRDTRAQIVEKVPAGYDEGVRTHRTLQLTVYGAQCWPLSAAENAYNETWVSELSHVVMEDCGLVWWSCFLLHHVDGWVCVRHLPGEDMASDCTVGRRQAGGGSVMLWQCSTGNLGSWHHVDMYHLTKHYCRPSAPLQDNDIFLNGSGLFQQNNMSCHQRRRGVGRGPTPTPLRQGVAPRRGTEPWRPSAAIRMGSAYWLGAVHITLPARHAQYIEDGRTPTDRKMMGIS